MSVKINHVSKDLNISLSTIRQFLKSKGFDAEHLEGNSRISDEMYNLLKEEFKPGGNEFRDKWTSIVENLLIKEAEKTVHPIFVFVGIDEYVNIESLKKYIVDWSTYWMHGGDDVFSKEWFTKFFSSLNISNNNFSIISLPQFAYLINYISSSFFSDRLVIVRDGVRSLLPLAGQYYIEHADGENIESRPDNMPLYMAEQLKIRELYSS